MVDEIVVEADAKCEGVGMGEVRRRVECASLIGQIDGLREHLRARTEERDEDRKLSQARLDALCKIGWVVWPKGTSRNYVLDELVEAVRKMGVERDALRTELDKVHAALKSEHHAYEETNRLRGQAIDQRDALQKRIDAALEYRSAWTAPSPADAIKAMVAILKGREP